MRTCVEKFLQQGCIVQRACVPEAHGSCVPSGQHEQIPLQKGSRARGLSETCLTWKELSEGWSRWKSHEIWESAEDNPEITTLPLWLLSNWNLGANSPIALTFLSHLSFLQHCFKSVSTRVFCPAGDPHSWPPGMEERELEKHPGTYAVCYHLLWTRDRKAECVTTVESLAVGDLWEEA